MSLMVLSSPLLKYSITVAKKPEIFLKSYFSQELLRELRAVVNALATIPACAACIQVPSDLCWYPKSDYHVGTDVGQDGQCHVLKYY